MLELARKVKVDGTKPRTAALQGNCNNIHLELALQYFQKVVTTPLLDYLTTQLNERFDSASITTCSGLVVIPSKEVSMAHKNVPWMDKFRPSAKFHESDRPCHKVLVVELDLWETYWLNNKICHLENISSKLESINFSSLSSIMYAIFWKNSMLKQ